MFQARFAQYVPPSGQAALPMGTLEEQNNGQNSKSGHQAADDDMGADGDVPATNATDMEADGDVPATDATEKPHESIADEDTKMDALANGQNGDLTSESRSNGES